METVEKLRAERGCEVFAKEHNEEEQVTRCISDVRQKLKKGYL